MRLTSPELLGTAWTRTLDTIAADGLLDHVLYVDLCNEFPLDVWAPFFPPRTPRHSPEGVRWMRDAIGVVRAAYPALPLTFSFTTEYDTWQAEDVSMHDFLELHCWMTHWTDFYEQVGYNYERFSSTGYEHLVANGERLYRARPDHWSSALERGIGQLAAWSRASGKPLVTTECWGVVDYKDWPLLDWGWVKELCEVGVQGGRRDRPLGGDGDLQLLRAAVRGDVARRRVAPADDRHHPRGNAPGLTRIHTRINSCGVTPAVRLECRGSPYAQFRLAARRYARAPRAHRPARGRVGGNRGPRTRPRGRLAAPGG